MTVEEIVEQIKKLGSESAKNMLMKHGAKEPFYGVKISDLKVMQKKIRKDHDLALALFDTGISDARYLAGLIAEPEKMTKKQLQNWVMGANWYMLSEYTVAWVAAESRYGWELAMEWIDSSDEGIAACGWSTLSSIASIKKDEELDLDEYRRLMKRVERDIHTSANRVRYTMNGFVIAVGGYITSMKDIALATANKIGKIDVKMGGTACKVPSAAEYIDKVVQKGYLGKKRKTAVC